VRQPGETVIPLIGAAFGTKLLVMAEDLTNSRDEDLAALIAGRAASVRAMSLARAAMEILYRRHERPLRMFLAARVIPSGDAEDVQQIAWQRVWHRQPGGFTGGNFRAWLYEIARNAAIDHNRERRPDTRDDLASQPDPHGEEPESALVEQARAEALRRCLDKLDPQVVALVRARLTGAGYALICQKLSLRPGQAHKMYHQAKKQLQACVERALS
jgi:RNA polymerase sigma-70 factor (ECF subfamily)